MESSGADSPINLTSEENDIFSALIEDEADNVKTDLNIHAEEYVPAIDLNNCTIEQFLSVVMKRKDLPKAQEGFIPIDQFIEKRIKEQNLEGYLPHVQRLTDKLILRVLKYLSVTRNSEPFPAVEVSKYLTSKPNILQYFENLGLSQDALTHEVFTLMRADKRLIYEQNYRNVAVFWLSEAELEKVIARVQLAQPPLPPGPPPISSLLAATAAAAASGGAAGAAGAGVSLSGSPSQPPIITSRGQQQQTLPLPQQAPFHPVEPRAPASVPSQPLLPSPVELAQKFVLGVEGRTSKTFPFSAHEIFQFLVDLGANEPIPLTDVIIDFMCQDPRVIYDNTWMGSEQVFHGTELFCTEPTKADNNSKEMFKKSRLHGMYHQTKQAAITMLTQLKNKTAFHVGHIQSIISKRTPVLSNDPTMQQSAKQDIITLSSSIFETMTKDVPTFLYDGSLTFRVPALGGGGVLIGGFYLANYASAQPESSHGKNTVAAALLAAKQQAKSAVVTKQTTEDSTTSTTTVNPVTSTFVPVLSSLPATAISAKPFQPSGSKTPSPDPKTQTETQSETQAPAETDPQTEAPTVTQPVTGTKTPVESEQAETEQADAQSETSTEADTTAQAQTHQAVPQGATELETVAVAETQAQSASAETVTCVMTESGSKAETQAVEALLEVETDAVTEPATEIEIVAAAAEGDSIVVSNVSTNHDGDDGSDKVEATEVELESAYVPAVDAVIEEEEIVKAEAPTTVGTGEVTSAVTETVADLVETDVASEEVEESTTESTTAAILSEIETLFYAHTASEVNDDNAVVSGDDIVDFGGAAVDVSFDSEAPLNVGIVVDDGSETLICAKDEGEEEDSVEVVAARNTNTKVAVETTEITLSASALEDVTEPSETAIVETAVESVIEQSETGDDTVESTTAKVTAVIDEPSNPSTVDATVDLDTTTADTSKAIDNDQGDSGKDDSVPSEAEVPAEVQDEVKASSTADNGEEVIETVLSPMMGGSATNETVSGPAAATAAVTLESTAVVVVVVVVGSDDEGVAASEVTVADAIAAASENAVDASVAISDEMTSTPSVDVSVDSAASAVVESNAVSEPIEDTSVAVSGAVVETEAASIPTVDDASVSTTVVVEPDAVSEPTVDASATVSIVVEPAAVATDVIISEPDAVDIVETATEAP